MPGPRLYGYGPLTTLCFLLSCQLGGAIDPYAGNLAMPATGPDATNPPAMMALPANIGTGPSDANASAIPKFYTITASLRETYDDNVYTSNINKVASLETSISPSILVNFPMTESDFSARYTPTATYYNHGGGSGNGSTTPSIDFTHELIAQYSHHFSDRFNFNVGEEFHYYTEPSIFESTGTSYVSGPYFSNIINANASAQWTPLFSTTTTYANTLVQYQNTAEALGQNSVENTGSHTFNFAVLPKVVLAVGAIGDDISYDQVNRGYTTYTGFVGAQWQILPSLSLNVRGGGSYTKAAGNQTSLSPYASVESIWTLGARSSLTFDYAHEVAPTDQIGADAEIVDRASASFQYSITPSLSAQAQGILTHANITSNLGLSGLPSYQENDYGLDLTGTYHYNNYLDFEAGYLLTGVSSDLIFRDYTRNQIYVGVRGTY